MEIVITKAQIVSQGKRALIGFFAGSNILEITATIKDKETKAILGVYEVKGDYNLGGGVYGILRDPIDQQTSSVAEDLVNRIYQ